jgi:acyl-CoA synthetase (AMP-forming)/AMP-acid ligase II
MSEIKQEFDAVMAQLTAAGAPYEIASDAAGVKYYEQAPANLVAALAPAREHGDREFLIYEGERRSYSDLMAEADAIGAALQARGIDKGDRVALAMRNYPEWMATFLGVIGIGAVIVPINSWGQPAEIAYMVEDAGARIVFCDQQRFDGIAELMDAADIDTVIARPAKPGDPRSIEIRAPLPRIAPWLRRSTTWSVPPSPPP